MIEYIKRIFRNYWVLSIFCVALGVALIIDPHFFTKAISYFVGGLLVCYGIFELIKYFTKARENTLYATGLVIGVALCAAGIFIIVDPDFIPKVLAIVFGLYMLISGICNLQDALGIRREGYDSWKVSGIAAAVTIIVGLVLLFNPLMLSSVTMIVLGISLLVSGLTNIVGCFTAARGMKKISKLVKKSNDDDEPQFIDI